jgi:hypothetical protein
MRAISALALVCGIGPLMAPASCLDSQYIGFDSRVSARLLGRLPFTGAAVAGFGVAGGHPVVLFSDRLLIFESATPREIALPYTATSLSVDSHERIRVQHGDAVDLVTANGVIPDSTFHSGGRLFGSGRPVLMDVYEEHGVQKFLLQRSKDDAFGLAGARGALRCAFWGEAGMAAVVEQSLYVWGDESKELKRLAIDKGLGNARGVCLVAPGRAVVALPRTIVVVSDEDQIVLAGMTARCDARNGTLYLLDERTGEIWSVDGVSKMGSFRDDEQFARSLISNLKPGAGEEAPALLEAARIIGCDLARKLMLERPSR